MNICYYTIVKEGGPIMSYETLEKNYSLSGLFLQNISMNLASLLLILN